MRVSVIVPTYMRPKSLSRCLDALLRQETQPDEILVVARREDEASRKCAIGRQDAQIRLVPIDVAAGRPGFVAALNAGVDASSGDVVCLTDDDAEPRPDWISRILAAFEQDPRIGAVGGRDWVYQGERLENGSEPIVGTINWWGRVIGKHHLGVGPPRDVAVLKGVNLSVRGDLMRQIRFDTRLLGSTTEHHSEIGLCLQVLRHGYRVLYDPAVAVDHRPQPRVEESREHDHRETRNAAHNETLAVLEYLPAWRQPIYLAWAFAIGTSTTPGVAQTIRSLLFHGDLRWSLFSGAQSGRILGLRTYLRSRRPQAGRYDRFSRTRDASATEHQDEVLAIGHSPGAAQRIGQLLGDTAVAYQPPSGWRGMFVSSRLVLRSRSRTLYLVDVGMSTAVAAVLGRLMGKRVILDTGDAAFALTRSLGDRSPVGTAMVGVGEQLALRSAHRIVVRGREHAARVPRPAIHIPDLAPESICTISAQELRRELGLESDFVVGIVGSIVLSPRLGISYGWDLVEAMATASPGISALVVGDGSGLAALRSRAEELGVTDRCRFVGRVPVERVQSYVGVMDAAISTQTNDVVGQVRTTAKLPLYLACGCPVLASHVGEAARLLGPVGWTLPYHGVVDHAYPLRLATAAEWWRDNPQGAQGRRATALRIARESFNAEVMRERLRLLLNEAKG